MGRGKRLGGKEEKQRWKTKAPLTPASGMNHPVHASGGIFDLVLSFQDESAKGRGFIRIHTKKRDSA
jgi:hypothetical protein